MVKWNSPGWLCSELKCSIKIIPFVWHGNCSRKYGKRVHFNSLHQNQYSHFCYKPHSIATTCFYTRSSGTIVIKHFHLPYKWIFLIKYGVITTAVKQFNNWTKESNTIYHATPQLFWNKCVLHCNWSNMIHYSTEYRIMEPKTCRLSYLKFLVVELARMTPVLKLTNLSELS